MPIENDEAERKSTEATQARTSADINAEKEARRVAAAFKYMTANAATLEKNLRNLDKGVKDGTKRAIDLGPALQSLKEQFEDLEDATDEEKKRIEKNIKAKEEEYKSAVKSKFGWDVAGESLKKLTGGVASGLKSLATSYQSNSSAFSTTAELFGVVADSVNGGAQALSQSMSVAGQGLMMTGKAGQRAGIALELLSVGISVIFKGLTDLTKFGVNFLAKEIDNTVKTFNEASSAGALFTNGITGMRNAAALAMLTPEQFSKVIAENAENLALFGGSVSRGITAFTRISSAMTTYRKDLLNLGLTTDEIATGQASYMQMLAIAGQSQRTDYANLAKETRDYLVNLRAIASFTGEDVKNAEKRATAAALEGDILAELTTMPGDLVQNQKAFKTAIQMLGPEFETMFKQVFMYKAPQGDEAIAYANLPAMQEIMRRAEGYIRAGIDPEAIQAKMKADFAQLGKELQREGTMISKQFGPASRLNSEYQAIVKKASATILMGIKAQGIQVDEDAKQAEKSAKTTDELTNDVSAAAEAMIEFRSAILETLNPGIALFAKISKSAIIEIGDALEGIGVKGAASRAKAAAERIRGGNKSGGGGGASKVPEPTDLDKTLGLDKIVPGGVFGTLGQVPGMIWDKIKSSKNSIDGLLKFSGGSGSKEHLQALDDSVKSRFLEMVQEYGESPAFDGPLTFNSGRRSYDEQKALYQRWLAGDKSIHNPVDPDKGTSPHMQGRAIDLKESDVTKLASLGLLSKYGFQQVSGDPVHIQMRNLGGTIKPGETALVGERGPELVSGGASVTSTASTNQIFHDMLKKLDLMVGINKDNRDVLEKILEASS